MEQFGHQPVSYTHLDVYKRQTMYLLSGSFEFVAIVKGHTMQETARFVASKLAPLDGVTGTATMFVLKQYKNNGVIFDDDDKEPAERLLVTP